MPESRQLDIACIKLGILLKNTYAVDRYLSHGKYISEQWDRMSRKKGGKK